MPPVKRLYDEILGQLTWDDQESMWTFEAGPIGGHSVRGILFPESHRDPLSAFRRESVRDFIQWIQENESSIRDHLTAELFEWWRDAGIDREGAAAQTPEEFRDRLILRGILFWKNGRKADVAYEQAGWMLLVKVRLEYTLKPGADIFEPGAFGHSRLFREAAEPASEGRPQNHDRTALPQSTAITEQYNRSPNDISDRCPSSEITRDIDRKN